MKQLAESLYFDVHPLKALQSNGMIRITFPFIASERTASAVAVLHVNKALLTPQGRFPYTGNGFAEGLNHK